MNIYPFNLFLKFIAPAKFPKFKGFSFRGALGYSLKKVCCPLSLKQFCDSCNIKNNCAYFNIFLPQKVTEERDKDIPRPFLFQVDFPEKQIYGSGDVFSLGLVLFGDNVIRFLPFILLAFQNIGRRGVGLYSKRGTFSLEKIVSYNGNLIYENGEIFYEPTPFSVLCNHLIDDNSLIFVLKFLTPTRIKKDGKILGPNDVDADALLSAIKRRIYLLEKFYDSEKAFKATESLSSITKMDIVYSKLRWQELERFSSRQKIKMKMGGLLGEINVKIKSEKPIDVYKAFSLLNFVHLGKNTVFGLGRIDVEFVARRCYEPELSEQRV